MYPKQLPIFKELNPYSGEIDTNNRWIKLSELVPWEQMETIYLKHFDAKKHKKVKGCRLVMGLMLGQMLMKMSNVQILDYFHENPFFQYFCGQDSFVSKVDNAILHHSLLSKRRALLGKKFLSKFEQEVLNMLQEKGIIKGKKLILDATVFPANITYPNDIKLLNTAREWCCKTILKVKNVLDPEQKIRTYRRIARKTYLRFQKTKRKSKTLIRKSRNQMLRYVKRNIHQLETLIQEVEEGKSLLKEGVLTDIKKNLLTAKTIYDQQLSMATTRGRRVSDRIVSFHQPQVRPIVRGKDGKAVEFGPKANVAIVDGFAILDDCQFESFHEGIRLPQSLEKHHQRFGRLPDLVLADQLYATRDNRLLLKEKGIEHGFKSVGRPPNIPKETLRKQKQSFKKRQGQRNHVEAVFGHLKSHFFLDKIRWTVPDGEQIQIRLGLIASNLHRALAFA